MNERKQATSSQPLPFEVADFKCDRVLCWVDSVVEQERVVRFARSLTEQNRGRCQVVKCLDATCQEQGAKRAPLTPERLCREESELAALYGDGVTTMVLPGHPVAEIRRFARNNQIDMIVMGEQGLALENAYGQRLVEDPPCAVMVLILPNKER